MGSEALETCPDCGNRTTVCHGWRECTCGWSERGDDLICDNCGNEDQNDFAPGEDGKPACGNCGWRSVSTRREVEERERLEAEKSEAENRVKADLARVEPEEW